MKGKAWLCRLHNHGGQRTAFPFGLLDFTSYWEVQLPVPELIYLAAVIATVDDIRTRLLQPPDVVKEPSRPLMPDWDC